MDSEDPNIIFAYIPVKKIIETINDNPSRDEEEDESDEEWFPTKKKSDKNPSEDNKIKPIVLNIKNPRPIKNLKDLIDVLEESVKPQRKRRRRR